MTTAVDAVRGRLLAQQDLLSAVRAEATGDGARLGLARTVSDQVLGAGAVVQPLLEDPAVTDVLVNGDSQVWVDRGEGLHPLGHGVGDSRALASRLATLAGQRLDDAVPIVDGRLPDGTRLHAVLAPLAAEGAHISLRTLRRRAFTITDLITAGLVDERGAQILASLVQVRANVLISGATGAGKTSLLASLLSLVPGTERIVCIEEAAELAPSHPHVVHLQVRRANVQGAGGIGLDALVRTALRMRPDRIVLGECRGSEVREVMAALNTGHDGGWATVHANSTEDVPARLVALGMLAGLGPATVAVQARAAFDAVLHLRRDATGRRVLEQIALLVPEGPEGFRCESAMRRGRSGELEPGTGWRALARRLDDPA